VRNEERPEAPLFSQRLFAESGKNNTEKHNSVQFGPPPAMQLPGFVSILFTLAVFAAVPSPVNSAFAPRPVRARSLSLPHRQPLGIVSHKLNLVSSSEALRRPYAKVRRVNPITRDYVRMSLSLILNAPILFIAWLGYSSLWTSFLPSHDARTPH
jgi:hypothetical protein